MTSTPHDPSTRQQRLEAVLAAIITALESGQAVDREALQHQHPDMADELREFFFSSDRVLLKTLGDWKEKGITGIMLTWGTTEEEARCRLAQAFARLGITYTVPENRSPRA
jgi:hypothetical protein